MEKIKLYIKFAKSFSPMIALINFVLDVFNKLRIPNGLVLNFRHHLILKYLEAQYKNIIKHYKTLPAKKIPPEDNSFLWVFWWQGLENAPPLVKKCISSIKANCPPSKTLIILDKNNYMDWLKIDPVIINKVERGFITLTHLSDILRMGLLSNYGGLWIDATIYVSRPIPEEIWDKEFYSNRYPVAGNRFISKGEWSGFLIGGCNLKLFRFCYNILERYNTHYDLLIDYFFIDYCIKLAINHFEDINKIVYAPGGNDDNIYELQSIMNLPYKDSVFNKVLSNNLFHKLDRKETFIMKTGSGNETNYSVWLKAD